jgi:hypothetical protein
VTIKVLTSFFHIWAVWPSFWFQATRIRTWHRNHQNKLSDQFSDICIQKVTSRVLKDFSIFSWCDEFIFFIGNDPCSNSF